MSDYFSKNMDALRSRYPSVADELSSAALPNTRRAVPSKTELPAYQIHHEGRWISLTSNYDPVREAERQVVGTDLANTDVVFVLGEAGLYHLEVVLQLVPSTATVFLVARKAGNLRLVFETRDLKHIVSDERVYWLISSDGSDLRNAFYKIAAADAYRVPSFELYMHPVEMRIDEKYYADLQDGLQSGFRTALMNYHTNGVFEAWWTKNFVSNLPYLLFSHGVSELKRSWAQKPAVIVGAGPSLNKNVHLLHDFKDKALIICVGTAYRILEMHGIVPDLIVSIDGGPTNASHFAQSNYNGIPLLMDVYCHKDIVRGHDGPKISLSSSNIHRHWWNLLTDNQPMETFSTGGSAATAAFYFARHIQADPVIMVGEDLSYPHGHRYAQGAVYDNDTVEDLRQSRKRLYEVEDIYGNTVFTTIDYLFYLKIFEQEALQPDRLYVNATEGGALKRGFLIQTLAECLETYCVQTQPVAAWKESIVHVPKANEVVMRKVLSNIQRSERELKAVKGFLSVLIQHAQDALTALKDDTGYTDLQVLSLLTEKMVDKVKRLPYAMAFLDACSFSAVAIDIQLSDAIDNDTEGGTQRQAILRMMQTLKLFATLRQKSIEAIESHRDGAESLRRFSFMEGGSCV